MSDDMALLEELTDELERMMDDVLSANLPELLKESLEECLAEWTFHLPDGTRIVPPQRLKLLSPDKTRQLVCYGGLRVSDTRRWNGVPDGWALEVQTRSSCWEAIAIWPEKADAVAALEKVSAAMEAGQAFLALE